MTGLGILSWIAGGLQLIVPSYALRLVRRFGASRVGWFVVMAFFCLALVRLFAPLNPVGSGPVSGIVLNIIYAASSLLLLAGMGHIETLFSERDRTRSKEKELDTEWHTRMEQRTSDLARTNQELLADVARREQIEKSLRESEAQYRFLFAENPQPMMILDLRTCRFLAVNKAALRQYGFTEEEFLALTARDLVPESAALEFLRDVTRPCAGMESRGVWRHRRKDQALIDVEITALDLAQADSPIRLILADNVSQRHKREVELRQIQKMEVIAQVSGGIAHQFDNLITSIESHASLLSQKTQDPQTADPLKHLCAAVARGSALTRQLLAVGGRHPMHLEPLDLNGLIRNQSDTLRRLVGPQVVLQTVYGLGLPAVLADRYLIEHALINLVVNARDAMPTGGTITINTASFRANAGHGPGDQRANAGEFVRINVRDTGCGMAPEVQARLFEPFFSTGKGAGLGLASVYGAVRQLSGWIEFTSEVGVGTEFKIFLPCSPVAAGSSQTGSRPAAARGKGTILLVEPDERLRGLIHCVLNWNGYRVIEADSSATASMFWEGQPSSIDLLVTTVILPDGSGSELAIHLQKSKAALKVIFTGESEANKDGQDRTLLGGPKFVPKPYSPDTLLQEVNECFGHVPEQKQVTAAR